MVAAQLTAEIQVEPFGPQTPRDMPDRPREPFRGRGRGIRGGIGLGRTTPSSGARTPTTGLGSGSRRHPAVVLDGVVTWGGGWAPLFIKAGELFRDGEVDVKDEEGEFAILQLCLLGHGGDRHDPAGSAGLPEVIGGGPTMLQITGWMQCIRASCLLCDTASPKSLSRRQQVPTGVVEVERIERRSNGGLRFGWQTQTFNPPTCILVTDTRPRQGCRDRRH